MLHAFFFFKQKTAYEMRISDWSSDVCSSDLARPELHRRRVENAVVDAQPHAGDRHVCAHELEALELVELADVGQRGVHLAHAVAAARHPHPARHHHRELVVARLRSEEHTSELQSLMRISYAVFCLKKKKNSKQ